MTTPKRSSRLERLTRAPYVEGLPEWDLFPSEEVRLEAIRGIERRMTPRRVRSGIEFLLLVMVLLAVPWFFLTAVTDKFLPTASYRGWITFGGSLLFYVLSVYLLLRRGMRKDLREALLLSGVPICLRCGHALCGLPPSTKVCPECGRPIGDRAAEILQCAEGGVQ